MKLLELYVSVGESASAINVNAGPRFIIFATVGGEGGEGRASSPLPFWEDGRDWQSTALRTVELNSIFKPDWFCQDGEQDWMIQKQLLSSDGCSFCSDWLERIGQALFKALFPTGTPVAALLNGVLRETQEKGTELHLRLKFDPDVKQQSRLADYPWELLHDGERFLLHRNIRLSRSLAYETVPPRVIPTEQLRVWLVSSQASDAGLGLKPLPDDEQQAIQAGLLKAEEEGTIALTTLPNGQLKTLRDQLTYCPPALLPQVLHFDGHGLYGQRCDWCQRLHNSTTQKKCQNSSCRQSLAKPEGFLVFENEQGQAQPISAQDFAAILPQEVKLVVLSACESSMTVASDSLFNGAAQQLIDHRVPAVVAMQYAVTVDAACEFSERFYQMLGQRASIVRAVSAGRQAMGRTGNQWYRPVLYLRSPCEQGGQLFCKESPWKYASLEQLYQLLKPVEVELWPAIEKAHRAVIALGADLTSKTLRQKLENFREVASEGDFSNEVRFVLYLLRDSSLTPGLYQALRDWAIQQAPHIRETLESQEAPGEDGSETAPVLQSTLMLTVRESRQDRGTYLISAGLTQDVNPKDLGEDLQSAIALGNITTTTLQNSEGWLDQFVRQCTDQHGVALQDLAVECFLPLELLHLAADADWLISPGRGKRPLSTRCKSFVVRALDRHLPNSEYELCYPDWRKAWRHLNNHLDAPWPDYFAVAQGELDQVLEELLEQDGYTGWQFPLPSEPEEQQELFDEMLIKAIPIALWIRSSELDSSVNEPFDADASAANAAEVWQDRLQNCCLEELPQTLTKARDRARRSKTSMIKRLALMWDNPFRSLPAIAYEPPSTQSPSLSESQSFPES